MEAAPRAAAIHDLSGLGRCSLSVILPVLSAMGVQCCPVPTALLSAHTGFPPSEKAVYRDLTAQLPAVAAHWAQLGLTFRGIYTGFLSSEEQIRSAGDFIRQFKGPSTLVLVDPVMGDHGKCYRTYTPAMCRATSALSRLADVIVPNLTEAALLLGRAYPDHLDPRSLPRWLEALSLGGARSVVITGVSLQEGELGCACLDRATGRVSFPAARRQAGQYPGTGDLFASVLLGALLGGASLHESALQACDFVSASVARTAALGTPTREGVQFERELPRLLKHDPV